MGPEKEIVLWWLNRNGFFTLSNIKLPRNREVEILAFKPATNEVIHVEISCSVGSGILSQARSPEAAVKEFIQRKFNDPVVEKVVAKKIKDFFGSHGAIHGYEKVIVLGLSAKQRREELVQILQGESIKVLRFEELLLDVMNNLDGQNYNSDIIRTLQLTKFLLLSSPKHSADLMSESGTHEILNSVGREEFLRHILAKEEYLKILQRGTNEELLLSVVKNSSLKKAKSFVKMIDEHFTRRSKKKIHRELSKIEDIEERKHEKKPKPLPEIKKEKSLLSFFSMKK